MDGELAANHYFARRALSRPGSAAQVYLAIASLLERAAAGEPLVGPWGGRAHPMPPTLPASAAAAALDGPPGSLWRWFRRSGGAPWWRAPPPPQPGTGPSSGGGGPPTIAPLHEALRLAAAAGGGSAVVQRHVPGPGGGAPGAPPLVLRAHLLLVGACTGFLHGRLTVAEGSRATTEEAAQAVSLLAEGAPARAAKTAHPAAHNVWRTAQAAASTLLSAVCEDARQAGLLALPNCFEVFDAAFAVDASFACWLLGCTAADDPPSWAVRDALGTALPLIFGGAAATGSAPRDDEGPGFVQVFRRGMGGLRDVKALLARSGQ
mmetsp:Transcript_4717/g.11454  ORF Transcript_4717/g.11454 Transcript_4717/m.11454 type:complete len:320 (-) Transcript_4717:157-1116(-)